MDQLNPAANPDAGQDEEIIDLTDIVEKGVVPGEGKNGTGLETQMSDLLGGGDPDLGEDFDLDALLAGTEDEIALQKAAMAKVAGSGKTEKALPIPGDEQDESFELPDMEEMDALLKELIAPEQPEEPHTARAAVPQPPAAEEEKEVEMDGLDALLASLDSGPEDAPAPARPEAAPPAGEEVEDLDSLLDSIMNPDDEPQTAPAGTLPPSGDPAEAAAGFKASDALDELDALLGESLDKELEGVMAGRGAEASFPQPDEAGIAAPAAVLGEEELPMKEAGAAGSPEMPDPADFGAELDAILESELQAEASAAPQALADDPVPPDEDLDWPLRPEDSPVAAEAAPEAEEEFPEPGFPATEETEAGTVAEDPLLIGELPLATGAHAGIAAESDPGPLSEDVLHGLEVLAADIAALREQIHSMQSEANPVKVPDDVLARLSDLQDDVQDMAESYSDGLAAAEARISALEAELAERTASTAESAAPSAELSALEERLARLEAALAETESGSVEEGLVQMENRLAELENNFEKTAAAAAAKVIREEIAALLSEL